MTPTTKKTTIYDIARAANLAASTVSRALDPERQHRISDKTRKHIAQIAAQLGYHPNRVARALSCGGTDTIAIVLPANTQFAENEYYSRVVMDSVHYLAASHVDLKVHALSVAEGHEDLSRLHQQLAVDGIIAVGLSTADHFKVPPHVKKLPAILFSSYEDLGLTSVDADNVQGGRLAAEHFIARGHTHLGMLTGPLDSKNALDRQRGYRAVLQAAGLPLREAWFVPCLYGASPGFDAAQQLCTNRQRPTAIFCANDDIASGALRAFQAQGLRCPHDISVIGFDDFMVARHTTPQLTSVAQPIAEMVRLAIQHILEMMHHGAPVVRMVVPVRLVERDSVGTVK
ncbi:MAG: LacI family DNA-binding transcriptional regulator [bacterium]|nr:LacI family DNA-binding transcriptional regulator [bacterium]